MKHISEPPPSLQALVPSISHAVEQIVMKAIAKDAGQRFETVQAFAVALEKASLRNGSSMSAPSSSSTGQSLPANPLSDSSDDTQPMLPYES